MPQYRLSSVLNGFLQTLQECRQLATDAEIWSQPGSQGTRPYISAKRRNYITEMAFLRAFQAWEVFIEESFILYMWGQKLPRGRAPSRYAFPPSHKIAMEWVIPEGRDYAQWTVAQHVTARAERFFKTGAPFSSVLRGNQNALDEIRTVRNAIAHKSLAARLKFEKMVRDKLSTLPPHLTVAAFLGMTEPRISPPVSFLEYYVGKIEFAARQIVPS